MKKRLQKQKQKVKPTLSATEQSLVAELVADGLAIQEKFRPEQLYKQTGKGHFESGAVEEIPRVKRITRSRKSV